MKGPATVDAYVESSPWRAELAKLREILRSTDLEETVKWGAPCYTWRGKNVVGMAGFQSYFGLWFHQGALLADEARVLVNAQEGKTKALRQWRFSSAKELRVRLVRAYVKEAIELVERGDLIRPERGKPLEVPPELEAALGSSKVTRSAFERLTPGKRREYADYVRDAKRAETRAKRVEKVLPMIRAGQGLNDKYRNC